MNFEYQKIITNALEKSYLKNSKCIPGAQVPDRQVQEFDGISSEIISAIFDPQKSPSSLVDSSSCDCIKRPIFSYIFVQTHQK